MSICQRLMCGTILLLLLTPACDMPDAQTQQVLTADDHVLTAKDHEIRWFFDGPIPNAVDEWFATFRADSGLMEPQSRDDIYLLTGAEDLSPKLRGKKNRLELKYRTATAPIRARACGVSGALESWTKVSWDYESSSEPDAVRSAFLSEDEIRSVISKERRQVKFRPGPDSLQQVPVDDRLDTAFALELTALEFRGAPFWTVGVDVFGVQGEPISYLHPVLCEILDGFPESLAEGASRGYAGWLGAQGE